MPTRKKARQDADIMLPVKSAELAKILESGIDYPLTINVNQLHASEFKLGDFAVTIQGTLHDLVCEDPLYFYFRRNSLFCMLVWNEYDNNSVLQEKFACATCDVPREVLENLLDKKAFRIVLNPASFQLASSTLILEVYITDNVILSLKSPSEILSSRSVKNVNGAVKHFKNIDYVQLEDRLCLKQSALKILDNIQNSFDPKNELQIFSQYLIPRLRHYQSQAVHWMLRQEEEIVHTEIHPLYTELELKENAKLYYQKYGGFFVKEEYTTGKPLGGILADEMGLGKTIEILALILKHPIPDARLEANLAVFLDSVSKRSTCNTLRHHIERDFTFDSLSEIYFECACGGSYESSDKKLMAQCKNCSLIQHTECMLYNTDVSSYDYLCPYCSVDPSQELLLSRGTVIISPASILYQWRQEIAKHIKENTLKVFVYRGVDQHKFINPQDLADHDIILISYEVLRRELSHLNVPHGASRRALRYPRKFSVIPSPLLAIKWWRICLDEAQMVEGVTSKAAEMALQLHTINRWCVTGTPIQKSAKDIYGLLLFLKYDPYDSRQWFHELLWKPLVNGNVDPMVSVLNQVMWRTSKKNVIEQLGIPVQETVIHKLQLSQVEKVFYETQREKCRNDFLENIKKYHCVAHAQLSKMDRYIVTKIMLPLKNLQRACCHHQLVRDTFVDVQKSNISMSALLNHLLQKSLYECEESHRAALCAMNGLAGIYSLREDYESACKMYKKILASIEEYSANVRTDPLQHIHVLYNFSNLILSLEKEVVANTPGLLEILQNVDCEEMKSKYNLLCENYVRRHREGLRNYWDHNSHVRCDVEVTFPLFKNEKKGFTESSWWYEIFQRLTEKDRQTFIEKVKDMLIDDAQNVHVKELPSVAHRFSEVSGFIVTLLRLSEELYRTRTEASNIVYLCVNKMNPDYVNIAKNCHLRPLGGVKKKCLLCQADTVLKQYESKLYRVEEASSSRSRRSETIAELESSVSFKTLRQGNHADSEFELILKFFMSYCRPFKEAKHRIEDGVKELKLLEAMKKEFKVLQTAWIKASEYMAAIDELEMAKMSMKTLQQTEPMAKSPVSKLIPTGMGNDNDEMQFKSDVSIFENILRKKLGQLYYLQNLKRAEGHEVHPFDQTCPVCVTKLTDTWCVLHCGHCFCLPCVQMVGKYAEAHAKDLSCPVCRSLTPRSEIYSVDRQAVKDDDETEIKGRYSSKIHGVLKCLLEIRKKNSKAKTIVFSSWKDFLFLLEMALRENNIKCVSLCNRTPNTFENYLPRFKSSLEENVLLLPLKVGANGMNITEATNVIIIEPVLDYSQIRQAIGRVYRMGQTERTFVYMFYVADTVEESIFNMNASFCVENEMLETVNDLKKLFE